MNDLIKSGVRSKQILQLLYQNGPLSISSIGKLISPAMSNRRIQDSIKRLMKKELIISRDDSLPKNAAHHYQIGQSQKARGEISSILDIPADALFQHHFRSQDMKHSEFCALWANKLSKLIPSANIVREHEFFSNELAKKTLDGMLNDRELRPDLLLLIPKASGKGFAKIAVEVERNPKKHERLRFKLKNFASLSLFDGVLYVCSNDYIVEALRKVYHTNVLPKVSRISEYGNHFLTFSGIDQWCVQSEPKTFTSELRNISFRKWIDVLATTNPLDRRDRIFEVQP